MKLYIKQKMISLGDSYKVLDENENIIYSVKSKLLKMLAEMIICSKSGEELYTIKRKMTFMKPKYEILHQGNLVALLENKSLFKKEWIITTSSRDLQLKGSLFAYNMEISEGDNLLATISKKKMSLTDSYEINILDESQADLVVTIVIALDNAYHNE